MYIIEEINNEIEVINKLLNDLSGVEVDDLIRSNELGKELNFATGVPYFQRMLNLFKQLENKDLSGLSLQRLEQVKTMIFQVNENIEKIYGFSTTVSNAVNVRENIISYFRDNYNSFADVLFPIIAYLKSDGVDLDTVKVAINKSVEELNRIVAEAQDQTKNILSEAESTLESIRTIAAESGVTKHSQIFKTESIYHSKRSLGWLFVTILIGVGAVWWGINSFGTVKLSSSPKTIEIVEMFASKLAILSAIYYVLIWSARNYSAHRHNTIVNKHRQNALDTFEAFVKAAGNDIDIKNAILLQATQTIFSNQSSGYLSKEGDQESPNKIIEIMRSVSSASKVSQ